MSEALSVRLKKCIDLLEDLQNAADDKALATRANPLRRFAHLLVTRAVNDARARLKILIAESAGSVRPGEPDEGLESALVPLHQQILEVIKLLQAYGGKPLVDDDSR
jgi:hypothetical protein